MIYAQQGFERRYKNLSPEKQQRIDAAIGRFEDSVGKPHAHSGLGLRSFGRYLEFRAGLDLRILVLAEAGDFFLMCVGSHNELRAYIKQNPKPKL
jgi:hypothetical protein